MDMDWRTLLWDLFSLLCQGTVAGLIVVAVTQYFDRNKARHLAQTYAIAVSREISQHLEIIKLLLANPYIPSNITPYEFETWCWRAAIPTFSLLPLQHIDNIATYYHCLWGFNEAIDVKQEHTLTPDQINYLKMCMNNGLICQQHLRNFSDDISVE